LLLEWVRSELMKPRPIAVITEGASPPTVIWSDGDARNHGRTSYPVALLEDDRLAPIVEWSDGSTKEPSPDGSLTPPTDPW
jgi:hypothetical protein